MPSFKISIDAQSSDEAAYLNGSKRASKMQLQPDKGGEGGSGIEDLLEDFIPRFTEIVEPDPVSRRMDSHDDAASIASAPADSRNLLSDHVARDQVSTLILLACHDQP